jgi:hypothetical protein
VKDMKAKVFSKYSRFYVNVITSSDKYILLFCIDGDLIRLYFVIYCVFFPLSRNMYLDSVVLFV